MPFPKRDTSPKFKKRRGHRFRQYVMLYRDAEGTIWGLAESRQGLRFERGVVCVFTDPSSYYLDRQRKGAFWARVDAKTCPIEIKNRVVAGYNFAFKVKENVNNNC